MRWLRGNFPIWQGRISFDVASFHTAVIYGAWHSQDYIHTHARLIPSFPSPLPHNFWSDNITLWCLESPAPCGITEPTIALSAPQHHLKSSLASSIIPLAPKQPPERLGILQGEALHPFPHKPFLSSSRFLLHLNLDTFCSSAAEEGSGQHPPSPLGAGASSICLAGANIFLFVSLFPWFQGFSSSLSL